MVTILASPSSRPPSREAVSLVCEAVPGTKGALRKRKVHGGREEGGGRREGGGREHGRSDAHTERAEKMNVSERYSGEERKEETALYIHLPVQHLYIASPL